MSDSIVVRGSPFFLCRLPGAQREVRSRLRDGEAKKDIIETFNRLVRGEGDDFPLPQPLSFRRKDINRIFTKARFMAALKSDGQRASLLLMRLYSKPVVIMVERSMCIHEFEAAAREELFEGTVIDGEVVIEGNKTTFLAFDMPVVSGMNIMTDHTYTDRHAQLSKIVDESAFLFSPQSNIGLKVKNIVPAAACVSIWRSRTKLNHLNDGVIFTEDKGLGVFKWKCLPTVDVLLHRNSYIPYVKKNGELIRLQHLRLGGASVSTPVIDVQQNLLVDAFFTSQRGKGGVVVECFVDITSNGIHLYTSRLRTDKTQPNHIHTACEVANSVLENVCLEEITTKIR